MGLVSLGFRARVRTLKRRELALARRVQEQTVTLRQQTETLTELSAKQSIILGSAGDGIIGLDAAGRISFINPSGAQMLGWSIDELLGRVLHELIHSSPAESVGPAETCFVCGTHADPPIRVAKSDLFRSRSSKTIPVELTSSTITTGGEGRPIGVVVTFRDITERHELERMKSEFVSTVSHELRTPLTSIRGALGLLASGRIGSFETKAKRMLDIATSNCDRLVRLINDFLDIERIESGRVELEWKPTDGEKLLTQAAETMQAMADRAGVRLEVGAAPGLVNVDPDRILQVITNLLSNAFKFSTAGSAVRLSSDCHEGVFSVHVSDQGRGIPRAKLALIFERFQQVDASDARDKGGTGLGLAICRSIARAHGGDISVESTEGVGSTFHLNIPDQAAVLPALAI
jgi:PAS domain S-box-containing protein